MVVKLVGDSVLVSVSKRQDLSQAQEFGSPSQARELLLDMGVPQDALDFYFSLLLPCLEPKQTLAFPVMNIPEPKLSRCGFRFTKAG
jgi:hypothetical protein